MNVSYTTLKPGGIADGEAVRTVEPVDGVLVDLDKNRTIIGVEVIGDASWINGLVALAMQGRLRLASAVHDDRADGYAEQHGHNHD